MFNGVVMEDLFFPLPTDNNYESVNDAFNQITPVIDTPIAQRNAVADPYLASMARLETSMEERQFLLEIGWDVMPEKELDGCVAAILELYPRHVENLQTFYMTAFDRLGEPEALAYWTVKMLDAQTLDTSVVLTTVVNQSPDYVQWLKTTLGSQVESASLTTGQAIENYLHTLEGDVRQQLYGTLTDSLYNSLFGHVADEGGKAYWVGQLESSAISVLQLMSALMNGAGGADKNLLDAKADIAYEAALRMVDHNVITTTDITLLGEAQVNKALQHMQDQLATYDVTELSNLLADKDRLISNLLEEAGIH